MGIQRIAIVWSALILVSPLDAFATQYHVTVDTSNLQGLPGAVVFEFTSGDSFSNTVRVFNFTHDGTTGLSETQGGLVQGDLILRLNPAPFTTIADSFFFNELLVPFTSFGTSITFTLTLTESAATGVNSLPPEFSLYLLGGDRQPLATADPLGADALFIICVDGSTTGFLSAFDPTVFTPPDQLTILPLRGLLFRDGFESGNTSAWSSTIP